MTAHRTSARVRWPVVVLVYAISAATALKLAIAYTTYGSTDVVYWDMFLEGYRRFGGLALYRRELLFPGRFNEVFNHPPFMIFVLRVIGEAQAITRLPFPFLLRVPPIVADVGSVALVAGILARVRGTTSVPPVLVAMALAPASLFISGFHGNTDAVMIFFVVLAVYLLTPENGATPVHRYWLGAAAFGMSLNIKVVPLLLVPVFFFYLESNSRRLRFFAVAGAVFLVGSLPYVVQDPVALATRILGYGGQYGHWGISRLLGRLPETWGPLAVLYARWGKYLVLATIGLVSWALNRRPERPALFLQCGAIMYLFLFLTPGFGVQYLAWLVPWVAGLNLGLALLYYATSGLFLFLVYNYWSGELPWYFADSWIGIWRGSGRVAEVACWIVIGLTVVAYGFELAPALGRKRIARVPHHP